MAKETLQMSGRAALKIAGDELDFMYTKMREDEDEIKASNIRIRVLLEERERQSAEIHECRDKADFYKNEWESRETDFFDLRLRHELVKALNVGLLVAAIWFYFN